VGEREAEQGERERDRESGVVEREAEKGERER
jgi:hypothetical protein